jgi:hypothetical protein
MSFCSGSGCASAQCGCHRRISAVVEMPWREPNTVFNFVVPNGYCLCAHSYCACELIC